MEITPGPSIGKSQYFVIVTRIVLGGPIQAKSISVAD